MTASELREKTPDELQAQLLQLKREAFNMRFQMAGEGFENKARIREIRRDTARVLTVMREQSAAVKAPEKG